MGTTNHLQGLRRAVLATVIGSGLLVGAQVSAETSLDTSGTAGRSAVEALPAVLSSCPVLTPMDDFLPGSRRMPRS